MTPILTPLVAALPLLTIASVGEHSIQFAPAEGLSLKKTITAVTQLDSDKIILAIDDNPEAFPPMLSGAVIEQSIILTDVYGASDGGHPLMLSRTYNALAREFNMEVEVGTDVAKPKGEGKSPLEGATVVFTQDTESGEYSADFAGDEPPANEHLEGLEQDTDFRGLLPAQPLDIGEVYKIPTAAFRDVLHAGGYHPFTMQIEGYPGAAGPEPKRMTDYRACFAEISDDKASGTLKEIVETGGDRIAVISLSFEMRGVADHAEDYAKETNEGRSEESKSDISEFEIELGCDGVGELRWNLSKGVLAALDFEAELVMDTSLTAISKRRGKELQLDLISNQTGEVKVTVRAEIAVDEK